MFVKAILEIVGEDLIKEIKQRFDLKGLRDTGEAKASLKVEATENVLKILGNYYIEYLNRGRHKGGKHPYNKEKRESYLLDWARRKTSSENEAKQMAYLVGRKLVREGSSISKDLSKGLELESVVANGVETLRNYFVQEIRTKIINTAKV